MHLIHSSDDPQNVVKDFLLKGGFGSADALKLVNERLSQASAITTFSIEKWLYPIDAVGVWALACLELNKTASEELNRLILMAGDDQPWLGQLGSFLLSSVTLTPQVSIRVTGEKSSDLPSDRLWRIIERGKEEWQLANPDLAFFQTGRLEIVNGALLTDKDVGLGQSVEQGNPDLHRTMDLLSEIAKVDDLPEARLLLGLMGFSIWFERASEDEDGDKLAVLAAYHLAFCEYADDCEKAKDQLRLVSKRARGQSYLSEEWIESIADESEERLQELTLLSADHYKALQRESERQMGACRWRGVFAGQAVERYYQAVLRRRISIARAPSTPKDELQLLGIQMGDLVGQVFRLYLRRWNPTDWTPDPESTKLLGADGTLTAAWWHKQHISISGITAEDLANLSGPVKLAEVITLIDDIKTKDRPGRNTRARCLASAVLLSTKVCPEIPLLGIKGEDLQLSKLADLYTTRNDQAHGDEDRPRELTHDEGREWTDFVVKWTDTMMGAIKNRFGIQQILTLKGVRIWDAWLSAKRPYHGRRGLFWKVEIRTDEYPKKWHALGLNVWRDEHRRPRYVAVLRCEANGSNSVGVFDASGEPLDPRPKDIKDGDVADIAVVQHLEGQRRVTTLRTVRLTPRERRRENSEAGSSPVL